MLTIALRVFKNKYLLSFAVDGLDGNGLQLEKIDQLFQILLADFGEIAKKLIYSYIIGEIS